jgi:hypothetical protein
MRRIENLVKKKSKDEAGGHVTRSFGYFELWILDFWFSFHRAEIAGAQSRIKPFKNVTLAGPVETLRM